MDRAFIPHLVIGVRADADRAEITAGFARASKRLRADANPPFALEELTQALAQLESSDAISGSLTLSVPADPNAVPKQFHEILGGEAIEDPEQFLKRITELADDSAGGFPTDSLALANLHVGINKLLSWDWSNALDSARAAHSHAKSETIADEALNLAAAALVMLDRESEAIVALEEAITGDWSLALRSNLALLYSAKNPLKAAQEVALTVERAPSQAERIVAIFLAVNFWRKSHPQGIDDEDASDTLPDSLRLALRSAVNSELEEAEFWKIGMLLARADARWVEDDAFATSPHSRSVSANLLRLRSLGMDKFITHLCRVSGPGARPWIHEEAELLIAELLAGLSNDSQRENYAGFAVTVLKNGLDCSTVPRINLRIYLAAALEELLDEESEPIVEMIGWLRDAKRAIEQLSEKNAQTELKENVDVAFRIIGKLFGLHRERAFQDVHRLASAIEQQLATPYGRRTANMQAVRTNATEINNWCSETLSILQQITAQMLPCDLRTEIQNFCRNITVVRDFVAGIR